MNDLQIGRAARALRHRLGWRQVDAADRARLGHDLVSRLERGRVDGLTLRTLRRLFAIFGAEVVITIRWRGGELDRIVDRRHASLAGAVADRLRALGWEVLPEVSYSEYGERGSIDLLAWHTASRTLLVIEIKTELTSVEETVRRHDAKGRLAAKIAGERFGWVPANVSSLLVLPDERTPRRHVEKFDAVLALAYPARGRALRAWLVRPAERISGLLFVSAADDKRLRQRMSSIRRVRTPAGAAARGTEPANSRVSGI